MFKSKLFFIAGLVGASLFSTAIAAEQVYIEQNFDNPASFSVGPLNNGGDPGSTSGAWFLQSGGKSGEGVLIVSNPVKSSPNALKITRLETAEKVQSPNLCITRKESIPEGSDYRVSFACNLGADGALGVWLTDGVTEIPSAGIYLQSNKVTAYDGKQVWMPVGIETLPSGWFICHIDVSAEKACYIISITSTDGKTVISKSMALLHKRPFNQLMFLNSLPHNTSAVIDDLKIYYTK